MWLKLPNLDWGKLKPGLDLGTERQRSGEISREPLVVRGLWENWLDNSKGLRLRWFEICKCIWYTVQFLQASARSLPVSGRQALDYISQMALLPGGGAALY